MLNPYSRSLYTSALTPPPGMVFDEAVATTFSMDPFLLLEAPVYLALMMAKGQTDPEPLSMLESIRRYSKRITVYAQRGRIQIPRISNPNPLFSFLEEMVIEVTAPRGGVFHPKVWAIRFISPDKTLSMYRLVVLSRNMTTDQSWDLSLQLEGSLSAKKSEENKPLSYFFKMLPDLAVGTVEPARREQTRRLADELRRVQWELPDGFDELSFYLPGEKKFTWEPPSANRLAIISPFCKDEALHKLVLQSLGENKKADIIISRPESLSSLGPGTLKLFNRRLYLDDAAATGDGEANDADTAPLATGLHAKVYLFEIKNHSELTHVVMGSANATNAALHASRNVEILVELVGKKRNVGGIDDLLSADGLGKFLVDFSVGKESAIDVLRQDAEKSIEKARSCIADVSFSIECNPGTKGGLWALILTGKISTLEGIVSVRVWPITVLQDYSVDILGSDVSAGISLGEFSASSVTGLIAFELTTKHPDVTARFVLNIPIEGIPDERNTAIMQTVISNQKDFFNYLMLLLGDDTVSGLEQGRGSGFTRWLSKLADGEDFPLLEELTRTFSRYPERLEEISKLIQDISRGSKTEIIPEDFLHLWSVFEAAIGGRNE